MRPRVLMIIVAAGCLVSASQTGRESSCAGPTDAVRITAQQLSRTPPIYTFLVTNLLDSPVRKIVVGRAAEHSVSSSVIAAAFNIPTSMASPERWIGVHVIGEESPYVIYMWRTPDAGKGILPGQPASGFTIALPALPSGQRKQYAGAREVVQTNFKGLLFSADTADGRCYWGTLGADLLDR